MLLLDITIVNVALPEIQKDFHASLSDLQWVIDAYALSLAALMLTAGSIADLRGRRLVFATGLGIFSLASFLCGLATSSLFLNLARGLQGVGGAMMFATSLALIASAFQGRERGTAFGIWGATIGPIATAPPITPPYTPNATPRSLPWKAPAIRASEVANIIAPPTPWSPRARLRNSGVVASPHRNDAAEKRARPTTKILRRPSRSASDPAVSKTVASISE